MRRGFKNKMAYRLMVWSFRIMDLFNSPDKRLNEFAIGQGDVVVDYGCGPGRYIQRASELVGPEGRVYAVDISRVAIDIVQKKIEKNNLNNVVPVLLGDVSPAVADHCADIVYALDMFHHIKEPVSFLAEIHRIIKQDGVFFLEDGHQSREKTKMKVAQSGCWNIDQECPRHVRLVPVSICGKINSLRIEK